MFYQLTQSNICDIYNFSRYMAFTNDVIWSVIQPLIHDVVIFSGRFVASCGLLTPDEHLFTVQYK